jgi:hypothetical protein
VVQHIPSSQAHQSLLSHIYRVQGLPAPPQDEGRAGVVPVRIWTNVGIWVLIRRMRRRRVAVIALGAFAVPSLIVTHIGEISKQTAGVSPSLLVRVESANGAVLRCLTSLAHALDHTARILGIHIDDFLADCRCWNDEWSMPGIGVEVGLAHASCEYIAVVTVHSMLLLLITYCCY